MKENEHAAFFLPPLFLMIMLVPSVFAADSMNMVQMGISGAITTKAITEADLTGSGKMSIIVGTSTGLYIFNEDGALDRYTQTSGAVSNVAVLGDPAGNGKRKIAISTGDVYFPNVICFDAGNGEKKWEFSPKTEVYDPYILWTMMQTSVFEMEAIGDINGDGSSDLVLSSGYKIYALDGETGKLLWEFQDTDNVWDLVAVEDQDGDGRQDVLAGDQDGYLYLISGATGKAIWSDYLSKSYTVMNPSTNSQSGSVKRSVWDIAPLIVDGKLKAAVSAEDGNVYLLDVRTGTIEWEQEVIDYVDALLYDYYGDNPIPTSRTDYNFFNLRVSIVDDVSNDGNVDIVASTFPGIRMGKEYKGVRGIYMINSKSGKMEWKNENIELSYVLKPSSIQLEKTYMAVPIGKSESKEKVRLIDPKDGSTHEIISINSTAGQARGNTYFLTGSGKNRLIMGSNNGDLALIEYPGNVIWAYPRINDIIVEKGDLTGDASMDMLVRSRDGADPENAFDEGRSRIIFVIDGSTRGIAWSYELPLRLFLETGGLSKVKMVQDLNGDGKSDIVAYTQYPGDWNTGDMYGENTRILGFSGKDGRIIFNRSVIENDYYGKYSQLFKDDGTLNLTVRDWLLLQMGMDEIQLQMMKQSQREEFDRRLEDKRREIMNRQRDFRIKKRIESLDIVKDQSGDGIPDFIIGSWQDLFIMDSVKGDIVWNRTTSPNSYQDPFTGEMQTDLYSNWTDSDRNAFLAIGDVNGDGMDDLVLVSWNGLAFLHSNITPKGLDYSVASRMTLTNGINKDKVAKVADLNGNGATDIVFERNVQDAPPVYVFADGRSGYNIMEAEKSGTTMRLNTADFNGNGFKDTVVFQTWSASGSPKLEIIDGRTKDGIWSYKGIEDAWMVRDVFGYDSIMPAAPVDDMSGDGIADVAVGRSLPWQPGAEVFVYDAKDNKQLRRVVIEDVGSVGKEMRWMPAISLEQIPDVNGDGNKDLGVIMAVGEMSQKEIKMFVVDIFNEKIISDFRAIGSEIINLGNGSTGMIGSSGNIFFLDTKKDFTITAPDNGSVTGSPVSVGWGGEGESVSTVLVDNKKILRTSDKAAGFEIPSGTHSITVYSFDRYGKGIYDSVDVEVVKSQSSITIVTVLVIFLLAMLFMPKIYAMVTRVKQ